MAALNLTTPRRKRTYNESFTMDPAPLMVEEEKEDSPRSSSKGKRYRSTSMYQWRTLDDLCKCMGALTLQHSLDMMIID